eukprot:3123099-Pyramimonas_sp.AAC.1
MGAQQQALAAKPSGAPFSLGTEDFPRLGQPASRAGRASKPPPGKAAAEAWPQLRNADALAKMPMPPPPPREGASPVEPAGE